jgi:hypothetical protein
MSGWAALSSFRCLTVDFLKEKERLTSKYSPSTGGVMPLGPDLSVRLSVRLEDELRFNECEADFRFLPTLQQQQGLLLWRKAMNWER